MTLTFEDAEDVVVAGDGGAGYTGFSGKVDMTATDSITESHAIHVDDSATSLDTKKTVIDMTTHSAIVLSRIAPLAKAAVALGASRGGHARRQRVLAVMAGDSWMAGDW